MRRQRCQWPNSDSLLLRSFYQILGPATSKLLLQKSKKLAAEDEHLSMHHLPLLQPVRVRLSQHPYLIDDHVGVDELLEELVRLEELSDKCRRVLAHQNAAVGENLENLSIVLISDLDKVQQHRKDDRSDFLPIENDIIVNPIEWGTSSNLCRLQSCHYVSFLLHRGQVHGFSFLISIKNLMLTVDEVPVVLLMMLTKQVTEPTAEI